MLQNGTRACERTKVMRSYLTILVWFVVSGAVCTLAFGASSKAPVETDELQAASGTKVSAESTADAVLVTVNGLDITKSDVEAKIKPRLERMARQGAKMPPYFIEQLKQQTLEAMIIEHLLDEKVKEKAVVVTEQQTIDHLMKTAPLQQPTLSLEDVKTLIEASGQDFEQVKQQVRRGLAYKKIMDAQWAGRIEFTEDDAKKNYSENIKQFENPEQIKASHILIKPDAGDPNTDPNEAKAQAKTKAEKLLKKVKDGADFATLAKANSSCPSAAKGGDLGFFGRGRMVPAFDDAVFELKVGQVSSIVETRFGYHIIKVTDRKDASTTSFEQARDDILKILADRKKAELAQEYIESLKTEANIVYPAGKEPKTGNISAGSAEKVPVDLDLSGHRSSRD